MKTFKKFIFIMIISLFTIIVIPAKAAVKDSEKDKTGTSEFFIGEATSQEIYGMQHTISKGKTVTKGAEKGQYINAFEMKTDGVTSKLVSWAVQSSQSNYTRANIIAAAKDYEAKHPGWIVTGGINADQYYFKFGNQLAADGSAACMPSPYYPMVSDGDKLFPVSPYNNSTSVVGFTNDGSTNSFVSATGLGGYQLTVLDEFGTELSAFTVNGINRNAGANETTAWCAPFDPNYSGKFITKDINTTNNLYVVEDAETAFVSIAPEYEYQYGAPTSLFCKGVISNTELSSYTVSKGNFAIETSNQEVIKTLENGVRIKVELLFANEKMNNVDEAMGYHTVHIQNNVDQTSTASYNTQSYSRAMMGKKADGTYVLITADYVTTLGSFGLNFTECNAVGRYFDCTDLYQMDGGGSVTAMIRKSDGTFKVTNYPKDSGNPNTPRANLSYLFFVKRDPGVTQNQALSTHHSIVLDKKELTGNAQIENIKVELNNQTYEFEENNQIVINGLDEKTTYTLKVNYDIVEDGKVINDYVNINVTTKEYIFPENVIKKESVTDSSITFKKSVTQYAEHISNIVVHVGNKEFYMGSNDEFTCEDLYNDVNYDVYCTYDVYDPDSGKTFHGQTEVFKVKTLAFKVPTIDEFVESKKSSSSVTFKYAYSDKDDVVTSAYILCNGEKVKDLIVKDATTTVTGLDFEEESYEFKLVLEYADENGLTTKVESEVITYEVEAPAPTPPAQSGGCSMGSALVFAQLFLASSVLVLILRKKH